MSEQGGNLAAMTVSPLWMSSTSALVLAVIGLTVQLRDRRLRWLDSPDRGRAQADLVSAWTSWGEPLDGRRCARALVTNASKQAVYDVFIDLLDPVSGVEERHPVGDVGRTAEIRLPGPRDAEGERWDPRAMFLRLYFQDLAYLRWISDSVGRLRPNIEDGLHWNSLETETAAGLRWRLQRPFRRGW